MTYADGGIQPCTCVALPAVGSAYSNVDQTLSEGSFGYGGRTAGTAGTVGDGMLVQAINVPDPCNCSSLLLHAPGEYGRAQLEPGRNYEPLYGTKYTLSETEIDSVWQLVLTAPDGTVWLFADPVPGQAYSTGPWEETVLADGQTTRVTGWWVDGQL